MASSHRDYMPRNAAQFRFFVRHLLDYVLVKNRKWETIPQARIDELTALFGVFTGAFDLVQAERTATTINKRNEAQAEVTKALRVFVNQYLRFPPVTNADRIEIGIPNHDTIRTDHTVVTEEVDFVIHVASQRELAIDFWQKGQPHKAKPGGYDGAVIEWDLLDTPPADQDALTHHAMASRTPYPLHFTEEERGKRVYIALRWQNERGILGQWSDIKEAIVP